MCHRIKFNHIGQTVLEISRFLIFNMAAVRHLGFLTFWFPVRFLNWFFEHSSGFGEPMCISMQNFAQIGQTIAKYSNLSIFWIWQPPAILDVCGKFWDDPQREFDGLYHYAKFGCTKVWIFCEYGLKTPIHSPFWLFWGKNRGKWKVSELLSL